MEAQSLKLINALNPQIKKDEGGQDDISINLVEFESTLHDIIKQNSSKDVIELSDDRNGFKVSMASSNKNIVQLQRLAHISLSKMMEEISCKKPLGVE